VSGDASDVVVHSRAVLAHHARTFNLASVFLTPQQRDDAAVVYSFCRLIDDLIDEAQDPSEGLRQVEEIRAMLDRTVNPTALIAEFLSVADRCSIPLYAAKDLIDGVASDVGPVTFQNDDDLIRYGYSVAGTVGLMMCGVIGVTEDWALAHAIDLGIGMQITNICRDVMEDAQRGRVYVPAERLYLAGLSPDDLKQGDFDPTRIAPVVADLLRLADDYYRSGDHGMRAIPLRPRFAIVAASRVYRAIGTQLRMQNYDVTAGRAVVPLWQKLAWVGASVGHAATAGIKLRRPHNAALHTPLLESNPNAAVNRPVPLLAAAGS